MLFTSAAFMFLFLPFVLAAYYFTPPRFRRYLLLAISVSFYILANWRTPWTIPMLLAAAVAAHFVGKWAETTDKPLAFLGPISCGVAVVLFILLRALGDNSSWFAFPLGSAIWLLSCVSYICDVSRRDAEAGSLWDALQYICFFPVMAAGPVIKYKDFCKYTYDVQFTVNNFAYGVKLFALGAVERMAVAGVMIEAYEQIIEKSNNAPNLPFGMFAAMCICLAMYFAFAGWTDMGVGLSAMFGIRLERDMDGALWAYSPSLYFSRILKGLGGWIEDYLISPVAKLTRLSQTRYSRAVCAAATVFCMAMWIKTTFAMMSVALVMAIIVFILEQTEADKLMRDVKGMRIIGFFLTFVLVSLFWSAGVSPSLKEFMALLNGVELRAVDYHIYYVYIVMSGRLYIITAALAMLLAPITCFAHRILDKLSSKAAGVVEVLAVIVLLLLFAFTVMYYMPQYPEYATRAFRYFIF